MNVTSLIAGIVGWVVGLGTIWIALPNTGTISRTWLRSQAGVLYPLIPVALIVFSSFLILRAFGLA